MPWGHVLGTEQQLARLDSRSAANTLKLVLEQRKHCCFEEKSKVCTITSTNLGQKMLSSYGLKTNLFKRLH